MKLSPAGSSAPALVLLGADRGRRRSGSLPSDSYLLPARHGAAASRRSSRSRAEGPTGPGGIYFVDVIVRKARLLEQLFSAGSTTAPTLVPARGARPAGRRATASGVSEDLRQMDRSQ